MIVLIILSQYLGLSYRLKNICKFLKEAVIYEWISTLLTVWCTSDLCVMFLLSGHSRSVCRKLPGQRDRRRRCEFVVRGDGGWWGSGGVPADDGKPAARSRDTARERGVSDGHQQPTPDGSGEDVDGHHRHHQPGTNQTSLVKCPGINVLLSACIQSIAWLSFWVWHFLLTKKLSTKVQ